MYNKFKLHWATRQHATLKHGILDPLLMRKHLYQIKMILDENPEMPRPYFRKL